MVAPIAVGVATLLAQVAPTLVSWVMGDRSGELAAEVVRTAAEVAGASGDEDLEQIGARILADQRLAGQLRTRLLEIEDRERQRQHDLAMAEVEDRADARATFGGGAWPQLIVGAITYGGLVAVVWLALRPDLPEPAAAIVTAAAGFFLREAGSIGSYYFGSSRGSADKQRTINLVARRGGAGAPPAAPFGR